MLIQNTRQNLASPCRQATSRKKDKPTTVISVMVCAIVLLTMVTGTKGLSPFGWGASTVFLPTPTRSLRRHQTSSLKSESFGPDVPTLCDRRRTVKSIAASVSIFGAATCPANGETDFQAGLKPATPSKPQIQLPDNASQHEGTLEGKCTTPHCSISSFLTS